MKLYASIKIGEGKAEAGRVCDDRILVDGKILEDGYYECEIEDATWLVAVADGVGGTGCGWKAAEVALRKLSDINGNGLMDKDKLKRMFCDVNKAVCEAAAESLEYKKTAATLSVLLANGIDLSILHVGDSRIYEKKDVQGYAIFNPLTEDHNNLRRWRMEEEASGHAFSIERLKENYGWNHITSYVGMKSMESFKENMSVKEFLQPEGLYILTTDGIHDFLDEDIFWELLEEECSWEEKLELIMQAARDNGSKDDQSIIVVEFE